MNTTKTNPRISSLRSNYVELATRPAYFISHRRKKPSRSKIVVYRHAVFIKNKRARDG